MPILNTCTANILLETDFKYFLPVDSTVSTGGSSWGSSTGLFRYGMLSLIDIFFI
jgi:hypothetical protein